MTRREYDYKQEIKPGGWRTNPEGRLRSVAKTYDLGDDIISVPFPKFVSQLRAVSTTYGIDSVEQLLTTLQGICAAEGIRANWTRWETSSRLGARIKAEKAQRIADSAEQREKEQAETRSFDDRVASARNKLADY